VRWRRRRTLDGICCSDVGGSGWWGHGWARSLDGRRRAKVSEAVASTEFKYTNISQPRAAIAAFLVVYMLITTRRRQLRHMLVSIQPHSTRSPDKLANFLPAFLHVRAVCLDGKCPGDS
jgi:hypothetical protein